MDFAFLIHSRDYTDVQRKFKIAKYLPKSWVEFWCLHWPPVVVSKITGLIDKEGKETNGWLIGVPLTAKQMMENRELAKKRVIQAVKKAEKLGAKVVGLGALTSSVTAGGQEIKDKIAAKITPGYAYTAFTVSSYVLRSIIDFSLQKETVILGIVGAAGSVGSSCAQFLASNGLSNFILVDLERKNHNLQKLTEDITRINPQAKITVSHQIGKIKEADIVIAATNAPEALIKPEDLKTGAIIIDDAQPSDISEEVMKQREDVLVKDGGVVATQNINLHFNIGLANKHDIFCCLAETLIIASGLPLPDYRVGELGISLIAKAGEFGKALGFSISAPQRTGVTHTATKIDAIKKIVSPRNLS